MMSRWTYGKATLFQPEDPTAPPAPAFSEPWQAQALAMASALIRAGHISASDWADTLGAALRQAEADGAPDTDQTYYLAVLHSLEQITEQRTGITSADRATRKSAWEDAYLSTPHGKPVEL